MWNIKKITILLCFLSLVAFISCSAEDKTGSPKPEGETEITGETGGGSGTGGSESGGSGESGSGGGGGETGETETGILTKKFPIPSGKYKDDNITEVTTVSQPDGDIKTYYRRKCYWCRSRILFIWYFNITKV